MVDGVDGVDGVDEIDEIDEVIMDILNALVLLLNFAIIPALSYASQLALGALGVTLIYGVLRFANFAHGEMMALGTVLVIVLVWLLRGWGVSIWPLPTALLALPFAIVLNCCVVLLIDRCVYRYYRVRNAPSLSFLIASFGVMLFLGGLTRFGIGAGDHIFTDGVRFIIRAGEFKSLTGLDEGLSLRTTQLISIFFAFGLMVGLFYFLMRTRLGRSMRAYSDNSDLATLSGISPERVVALVWILAASLATIAGTLYGLDKSFKPFVYMQLLLPIFASAVLGGLGSPLGAVAGAFIVAFSEIFLTFAFRKFLGYIFWEDFWYDIWGSGLAQFLTTDYKFAVSFLILVLVLLFRPRGLFGRVDL